MVSEPPARCRAAGDQGPGEWLPTLVSVSASPGRVELPIDPQLAMAWSGGKDAALALHVLAAEGRLPGRLVTTLVDGAVPHHGVPAEIPGAQSEALGLPLVTVAIPQPFDEDLYHQRMADLLPDVTEMAFGDLFLGELRLQRERTLARAGVAGCFPLWGRESAHTAREILEVGIDAVIVAVDSSLAALELLGCRYDSDVIEVLEQSGADPCGENGEFHTVVVDAPLFSRPLSFVAEERHTNGQFHYLSMELAHAQGV